MGKEAGWCGVLSLSQAGVPSGHGREADHVGISGGRGVRRTWGAGGALESPPPDRAKAEGQRHSLRGPRSGR